MNCKYPKKFDSPAEKAIFPMLNTIAIRKDLYLEYQFEFGFQGGGYESKKQYCEENGIYYNGKEDGWEDSSWESEEYRADYAFEKDNVKIAVEVDGKEFHKNKDKDKERDQYLNRQGFTVLHFEAKMALRNDLMIKEHIEQIIELQQQSDFYTPNSFYFSCSA